MSYSALITGSTSGIGLGIAHKLASIGYDICFNGIAPKDLIDNIVKSFKALYGGNYIYSDANLEKPEEIKNMISFVLENFPAIDVLINNAGIQYVSPIESFPEDKWDQIISINLASVFYTTKYSIPHMKKRNFGKIINISSAHGIIASPFKSAYVATKHAVLGLTKAVALEVAETNIRINAICPGYVKTPLVLNQIKDTANARGIAEEEVMRDVILASQSTKKFVEIDEIANVVEFLCSDKASSMTGASIVIDGGWSIH